MEYKENDLVLDVGQAESISEEIERESRRYSYGFTEEDGYIHIGQITVIGLSCLHL